MFALYWDHITFTQRPSAFNEEALSELNCFCDSLHAALRRLCPYGLILTQAEPVHLRQEKNTREAIYRDTYSVALGLGCEGFFRSTLRLEYVHWLHPAAHQNHVKDTISWAISDMTHNAIIAGNPSSADEWSRLPMLPHTSSRTTIRSTAEEQALDITMEMELVERWAKIVGRAVSGLVRYLAPVLHAIAIIRNNIYLQRQWEHEQKRTDSDNDDGSNASNSSEQEDEDGGMMMMSGLQ